MGMLRRHHIIRLENESVMRAAMEQVQEKLKDQTTEEVQKLVDDAAKVSKKTAAKKE
jgi:hypothetical protein